MGVVRASTACHPSPHYPLAKPRNARDGTVSDPFAEIADRFAHNNPLSASFSETVCTLGTTPPRVATPPAPGGGIALHEGPTRRRHAVRLPRVVQNPHHCQYGGRTPLTRPGAVPVGAKKLAQRTCKQPFSPISSLRGELFRASMKPPPPLLAHSRVRMKPATPLLAHNAPKSSISCEQRCQRFHPTTKTGPQWCHRFQPGNALHRIGKRCTG